MDQLLVLFLRWLIGQLFYNYSSSNILSFSSASHAIFSGQVFKHSRNLCENCAHFLISNGTDKAKPTWNAQYYLCKSTHFWYCFSFACSLLAHLHMHLQTEGLQLSGDCIFPFALFFACVFGCFYILVRVIYKMQIKYIKFLFPLCSLSVHILLSRAATICIVFALYILKWEFCTQIYLINERKMNKKRNYVSPEREWISVK